MRAWIDPHWYEGDGMTVVHSDDVDEARNLLGMDEGSMPERCEAMDDLDGHSADVAALALMLGVIGSDACVGCDRSIEHYREFGGPNTALLQSGRRLWGERPLRMEGVGMFCSEECWRQSPWGKRP